MQVFGQRLWVFAYLWAVALQLQLVAPVRAKDFPHRAEVLRTEDLTHNVKRIRLKLQTKKEFDFTPGQYVFIRIPEDFIAEWNQRWDTSHKQIRRPYSFASSPRQLPCFDFIIKHYIAPPGKDVPPGIGSTYIHKELQVGDTIQLSPPTGRLYVRQDSDSARPIIVVAGGVGASPFVCLLEYWFENRINEKTKISFFFGVRSKRDLLLHEQFSEWAKTHKNFQYVPALSHPQETDHWSGETGYVNLVLSRHLKGSSGADAYLAGPPIMIRETVKVLNANGIPKGRINHDPIQVR